LTASVKEGESETAELHRKFCFSCPETAIYLAESESVQSSASTSSCQSNDAERKPYRVGRTAAAATIVLSISSSVCAEER
jgi:hypothetical protein